jgi:hypothetical protein
MNAQRKVLLKKAAWGYPLIIVGAFLPIIVAVGTGWIASLFGVQLNEGSPPQIGGFAGPVISELLYVLTVFGWLFMLTMPAGAVAFISFTTWLVLGIFRRQAPTTELSLPPELPR